MQIIDTTTNGRIDLLLRMLSDVSRASSPVEAANAFGSQYWRVRRIDMLVTTSRRDLPEGQYKITKQYRAYYDKDGNPVENTLDPSTNPWASWNTMKAHTGGFLGELMRTPTPKLVHNLDVRDDPALGDTIAEMGSCIVLPLLDQGEPINWAFQFRVDPRGYSEADLEQALLIGNLVGSMTRNLVNLDQIRMLNQALSTQFEEVARVQQSLLPKRTPPISGVTISTSYLTSEHAGGDYYDFFDLGDDRWGILIADVAGHGAGAATVMAMLHAILHSYPHVADGPAQVLRFVNDRLVKADVESRFVTALFAVYNANTRTLTYARAGHPQPRLKDINTGEVAILDGQAGLPLGIIPDYRIEDESVGVKPGQTIILYTDGITEAFNPHREMFGVEGLDAALRECSGRPGCVVDTIYSALFKHTGTYDRDDDQTLVVFSVDPLDEHSTLGQPDTPPAAVA